MALSMMLFVLLLVINQSAFVRSTNLKGKDQQFPESPRSDGPPPLVTATRLQSECAPNESDASPNIHGLESTIEFLENQITKQNDFIKKMRTRHEQICLTQNAAIGRLEKHIKEQDVTIGSLRDHHDKMCLRKNTEIGRLKGMIKTEARMHEQKFVDDRFRTEICRQHNRGLAVQGAPGCRFGDKCHFAHGAEQLKPRSRNNS